MIQKQVQEIFSELAESSCYALCLVHFIRGSDTPLWQYMIDVCNGYKQGFILGDGTVVNPVGFLQMIDNHKYKVTWVNGAPDTDISYPTFFSLNGKNGHFVLANKNGVTWNSLSNSKNVNQGKIYSYRKIEII